MWLRRQRRILQLNHSLMMPNERRCLQSKDDAAPSPPVVTAAAAAAAAAAVIVIIIVIAVVVIVVIAIALLTHSIRAEDAKANRGGDPQVQPEVQGRINALNVGYMLWTRVWL